MLEGRKHGQGGRARLKVGESKALRVQGLRRHHSHHPGNETPE